MNMKTWNWFSTILKSNFHNWTNELENIAIQVCQRYVYVV